MSLGLAALLLATAALPAGADHSTDTSAAPTPLATLAQRDARQLLPTTRPAADTAAADTELLHAIPAADVLPAAKPPAAGPAMALRPAVPGGRVIWMEVTAYCGCKKCCGPNAHGITASGHPISFNDGHFIAADTSLLPFFTRVIIPGYDDNKPVPVIDRGGAIKGNHIDVFFPQHQTAVDWGKRWIAVTVLP